MHKTSAHILYNKHLILSRFIHFSHSRAVIHSQTIVKKSQPSLRCSGFSTFVLMGGRFPLAFLFTAEIRP